MCRLATVASLLSTTLHSRRKTFERKKERKKERNAKRKGYGCRADSRINRAEDSTSRLTASPRRKMGPQFPFFFFLFLFFFSLRDSSFYECGGVIKKKEEKRERENSPQDEKKEDGC